MIITLTTDFGESRGYVGAMKGVISSINPEAKIVDIAHDVVAHDPLEGALTLLEAAPFFPAGTIHVAVIDPGVGSEREALIIKTGRHYFIGPNNGVFSLVLRQDPAVEIRRITKSEYMLPRLSDTFHGRDIFSPAAGFLSRGISPDELGEPFDDIVEVEIAAPRITTVEVSGQIIAFDRFGNAITNISIDDLDNLPDGAPDIRVGEAMIPGLSFSYSEVEPDGLLAIIGSGGVLEISANRASVRDILGLKHGDPVYVKAAG